MNWKTDLLLADLEKTTAIEVACKRCGKTRYEKQAQLMLDHPELKHAFLDEVEFILHCADRSCRGGVRIALIHDDKNERFVGGMA